MSDTLRASETSITQNNPNNQARSRSWARSRSNGLQDKSIIVPWRIIREVRVQQPVPRISEQAPHLPPSSVLYFFPKLDTHRLDCCIGNQALYSGIDRPYPTRNMLGTTNNQWHDVFPHSPHPFVASENDEALGSAMRARWFAMPGHVEWGYANRWKRSSSIWTTTEGSRHYHQQPFLLGLLFNPYVSIVIKSYVQCIRHIFVCNRDLQHFIVAIT